MAAVSATCVRFGTSIELPVMNNNQRIGKNSSLMSLGWARTGGFPSIRTSPLQICAAKPETMEKVSDICAEAAVFISRDKLTPQTTFTELGADSLDTVEIVMGLEEAFDICVEETNSENITCIEEAADLIDKLCESKA